ncbi:ParB/RepB/Spo0J family partition protein [Roseospira marina]|uniref:ParB/RepB/Spo0J family partition protein n=1 Tax=Roseospira marina TaxID=140057 RepID=UPI001478F1D2|nr:ParB N-terminal domain-containing protein [Roseospira marina]MBB4316063.1 ParB family chromosome partitioning protein [Roseospira marina]MBB5089219.1 ParB family chromosome partitioning protein [Roseospira marina]
MAKSNQVTGPAGAWQGERMVVSKDSILFVDRLREIDPAWAETLAESIRQQGLVEPPVVRPDEGGGYALVAGAHRYAAMVQHLGWTEIPVVVVQMDDLSARLLEIDENLCRRGLEPLDRAVFLAERKAVYEALHPEAVQGAAGAAAKLHKNDATANFAVADPGPAIGFAREVRERIGLSERTIYRAVQVAGGLAPDVRRRMQRYGHWKEGDLYALSKLAPDEQAAVVDALLTGMEPGARPDLGAALKHHKGEGPQDAGDDGGLSRLLSAWNRADGAARKSFLGHLRETGALKG